VVDRRRPFLDELDVEFYPLVRLIGDGANLLLLIGSKRILGALRVCTVADEGTCSCEQKCGAGNSLKLSRWEMGLQMI
jgi:hypothetical protein